MTVPFAISSQSWPLAAVLLEGRFPMEHFFFVAALSFWNHFHFYILGILFLAFETGLIVVLLAAEKRAKRDHRLLQRRFAIETVISRCSARLSACSAARVEAEIQEALQCITISEEIDYASWSIFDRKSRAHVYYACADTGKVLALHMSEEFPWITEKLLSHEPVVLQSLSDLPQEAQLDTEHLAKKSIKAAAFIPCGSAGEVQGILVLARTANELSWPTALVDRLGVLGNVFANAFMRKQAQQAEEESQEKFRYLFEEAPIGIAMEDLDGKILFANPALCSLLGYEVDEIVGMHCYQFSDPDATPEDSDWAQFQDLRAGIATTYRTEKRYLRKDGGRIWGRLNVSLLRGSGDPIILATVEDVTAAKQAASDLNDLNNELRQLTARLIQSQEMERQRIARELHDDISQRLALLMMDIDAWQGEIPFERTSDHSTLRQVMAQLDELSTDVHNLSHRLHSTKLKHLGLPGALQELCQQLSMRHSIPIDLDTKNLPHPLPELVSLCFYRVAQEALKNAVKHSGSPRIKVKVTDSEQMLRMYIQDFGSGFDTTAPMTGLGLMTMQERLRMVGGTLRINAVPASGTEIIAEARLERSSMAARVA